MKRTFKWKSRLAGGSLVVLAAGLLAILGRLEREAEDARPPAERTADQLERVEGGLRVPGEDSLFDGYLVAFHPDGTRLSRSRVVNGRLQGISEGWYSNGRLEIRESFKEGASDGSRMRWRADGTALSCATLENGRLNGAFVRWHPNGRVSEWAEMRNGETVGVAYAFHENGSLKARARLENGEAVEREQFEEGREWIEEVGGRALSEWAAPGGDPASDLELAAGDQRGLR